MRPQPLRMTDIINRQQRQRRRAPRRRHRQTIADEAPLRGAAEVARGLGAPRAIQRRIRRQGAGRTLEKWLQDTQAPPGLIRVSRLMQDFAEWFEQKSSRGQKPNPRQLQRTVKQLSTRHNVPAPRAMNAVRGTLTRMNLASKRLQAEDEVRNLPRLNLEEAPSEREMMEMEQKEQQTSSGEAQ